MPLTIAPDILKTLSTAKRIVILTGAGLSAESGIPTFRDTNNSLWTAADPMAVASLGGFQRDPERVWAWHETMRKQFAVAKPNPGHDSMAVLEMLLQPARIQVITQNIDGLHQEAGSTWVLELHGTANRVRCHRRCGYLARWDHAAPRQCPICAAPVRPDVVWFGEALDEMQLELARETAEQADIFLTVGTSGTVQPATSLVTLASNCGATVIEVNLSETPASMVANYFIRASAGTFFPALCQAVRKLRLKQTR